MTLSTHPIGIFDSGLGGLTVLRQIRALLPQEEILYFADTARLPYGNKSPEAIARYTQEGIEFLLEKGVKAIILACNTACACTAKQPQNFPIPLINIVEEGIRTLTALPSLKTIAVLATRATIDSNIFPSLLPLTHVLSIACPLFRPPC